MSKIINISTAVPKYAHQQMDILKFMENAYHIDDTEKRKLRYLYKQSDIEIRHSVLSDYNPSNGPRQFYSDAMDLEPFPDVQERLKWFDETAPDLSLLAIERLGMNRKMIEKITHLVTVSCTGLSAPGLELEIMERLGLRKDVERTAINFMGCYAAMQGLKNAHYIVNSNKEALVLVVCTELCTLHFQKEYTPDAVASSLLFGDGCAAVLVAPDEYAGEGLTMKNFYSEVVTRGKRDMAWNVSPTGFIMTLSSYVPQLILNDLEYLKDKALEKSRLKHEDIDYWCIHPGGKRVVDAVQKALKLSDAQLDYSRTVLREHGNMSSATILFVLKSMWHELMNKAHSNVFGAAFGPGLTMESFVLCR